MAENRVRIDSLTLSGVPQHRRQEIGSAVAEAVRKTVAAGAHMQPGALDAAIGQAIAAALAPKPGSRQ